MDVVTLANLVPYLLQSVSLAILATALAALIRIDSAAVRYAYWRAVLAASAVLPFLQPLQRAEVNSMPAPAAAAATTAVGPPAPLTAVTAPIDWTPIIVAILAIGVAVRLVRVVAGVWSLQRLRSLGVAANNEGDVAAMQETLGVRADVRFVPGLTQPATFGLVPPVVLLPDGAREQPAGIQRALLAHELLHVQRRDWLWVVGEELLLAVCWFNPATWWIVSQVRRAREESVDELAILATGSRRTYVKALLAYAGDTPLSPAPAFAHRRHLFRRILLISTEAAMSSTRIVCSCAVMAGIILTGSWYVAAAFPLSAAQSPTLQTQGAGPFERRANPVTSDNPVPKRTDYQAADYPIEARAAGVAGAVTLRITLDEVGRVVESRRTAFSIQIANPQITASFVNTSPEAIAEAISKAHPTVQAQAIVRALDALTNAASQAVSQWRYEPPKAGPISFDVIINFKTDGETSTAQATGIREGRLIGGSVTDEGAVRVGGNIKAPTKVKDVRPVYPPLAQSARVSGMVIVEARIGRDGRVEAAQVLRSIPLLDQAALDAVYQWQFVPTLLNGVPTPVIMTVTVNFTLQ